jgi:hypothetical protein
MLCGQARDAGLFQRRSAATRAGESSQCCGPEGQKNAPLAGVAGGAIDAAESQAAGQTE